MIQISDLRKSYGDQVLFEDASFSINPGERLGLVGRNGHGKTTLFRILSGQEDPDSGQVHIGDDYSIGYLSQHLSFTQASVLEEAALGLKTNEDAWQDTYKAEAILQGLGFSNAELQLKPAALSGGFQVRLNLAKLIASEPNLLLLDEPTNYLDIVSMRWLSRFLTSWRGELIIITHDHGFMNEVSTHTLGIHRQKVRKFEGPTHKYYEQLELEEDVYERGRLNQEKKVQEAERFIRAFRAKASKAKAVQSRIKALDRMGTSDKLADIDQLDFNFTFKSFPGKRLIDLEDVSFHYPGKEELLIDRLSLSVGAKERIGVIGRNGKGKSTLLKMIASELTPVQGVVNSSPNTEIAYFGQTNVERLNVENTIEAELLEVSQTHNRTQARTIAGHMMFEGDTALKKIKVLSGGEKSRVLLGKLLLTPANLLILDEPDNHLDMFSTDALMEAVHEFPGSMIMVTHSEMLLRELVTKLIVFDRGKVEIFEGDYEDFLRRRGWGEEGDAPEAKRSSQKSSLSKKELRKKRADITQRRSELLGSLQKEAKTLEKEITQLEKDVKTYTQDLIEATKDGFGDDGAKLSRLLHTAKEEVEVKFERFAEITEELEEKGKAFDLELEELEGA